MIEDQQFTAEDLYLYLNNLSQEKRRGLLVSLEGCDCEDDAGSVEILGKYLCLYRKKPECSTHS